MSAWTNEDGARGRLSSEAGVEAPRRGAELHGGSVAQVVGELVGAGEAGRVRQQSEVPRRRLRERPRCIATSASTEVIACGVGQAALNHVAGQQLKPDRVRQHSLLTSYSSFTS
jgi:hypothetical protein